MLFVSDVHGAFSALRRVVALGEKVVVLGDLANLTDYRTGEGAVADVLGIEFARESSLARARGDFSAMRDLWEKSVGDAIEDVRREIGEAIRSQYVKLTEVLADGTGYVIHGNVDRPDALRESLPGGFEYVHGRVVEFDGLRIGFVGGGVATPLQARGEVSDEEMSSLLEDIGRVDVLCTHVPAAVRSMRHDVITGRDERGSEPIRRYLASQRPRLHLFGDVHQPMASTWRVGPTRCHNAGYFRATGRYLQLENDTIHVGRVS